MAFLNVLEKGSPQTKTPVRTCFGSCSTNFFQQFSFLLVSALTQHYVQGTVQSPVKEKTLKTQDSKYILETTVSVPG